MELHSNVRCVLFTIEFMIDATNKKSWMHHLELDLMRFKSNNREDIVGIRTEERRVCAIPVSRSNDVKVRSFRVCGCLISIRGRSE